jgi:hypothetical protein
MNQEPWRVSTKNGLDPPAAQDGGGLTGCASVADWPGATVA